MNKCDSLNVLFKLETIIDEQYTEHGYVGYNFIKTSISSLIHDIQIDSGINVNDLKKELDIYHN